MPLSHYLKIYHDSDRPGSYLLYSTRKGSVVRLSGDRLEAAREGTLTDTERETLRRLEILIDDPEAEQAAMTSLVKRANARNNRFYAKVVMNLDCNLACPYCFEDHFRGRHYMTRETARLLVDTVISEQIGRGREVKLGFYGGEPLLSLPLIREIARPLLDAAQAHGTKFSFGMTTNGTLLTRTVVEELLPLGLTGAILTLDGPREIHDRQRPFVSGVGSYDIIVANIKASFDLIELQLGGNFFRDNYREFPRVLDHIIAEGIPPERLGEVQFAPIMPKSGRTASADTSACCASGSEPWVTEAAPYLREEILKRGFKTMKPTQAACVIEFDNHLVVNYDGSLYKCSAFMGWPELSIGTLAEGTKDYSVSHNLDVWKTDECLDCAYLPLCFGGCRYLTLLKNGVIDEVDCRKDFYDAALERFILQDLRYPSSRAATKETLSE
ncbi:geopeptide radical SAM maturase [Geotalea uraniireducens]|uniref:Radical SAM domain protein n=1 Tax=Geotalea uraniireducens (strain Rf4) TaxID=351605 RepID=A5GFE6_GEOUR|nr:geopeptide radical SAM maturase [Geotalea uraniireducens]ABQ26151.1 Radical SAM domain protein [Geotalea uraniireducens Rf4]